MTPYSPHAFQLADCLSLSLLLVSPDPGYARSLIRRTRHDIRLSWHACWWEEGTVASKLATHTPDIIVCDLAAESHAGLEGLKKSCECCKKVQCLALVADSDKERAIDALYAGARGVISRNASEEVIIQAIWDLASGETPLSRDIARIVVAHMQKRESHLLTPREKDVLYQLCEGKSYKMISTCLFISQDTVRSHIKSLYRKLDVNSKSEAVAKALRNHWV